MAKQLTGILSPREMECLRLRADGLQYHEIADVLGVREGTVSAMLSRVHKKLREEARESPDGRSGTLGALYFLLARESDAS
jgi:DNA-binding NarL/FixJ family response regulator